MPTFLILFALLFLVINRLAKRKYKNRDRFRQPVQALSSQPTRQNLETAENYFGSGWQNHYNQYKPGAKFSATFYEIVGLAIGKLDAGDLIGLSYFFAHSSKTEQLYARTAALIKAKQFSEDSMKNLFHEIALAAADQIKQTTNPVQKTLSIRDKDSSIIDVTSLGQKIDTSTAFKDLPEPVRATTPSTNEVNLIHQEDPYYNIDFLLGTKYKKRLSLTSEEVALLNRLWSVVTVFLEITLCCEETIKLFLTTLKILENEFKSKGSSIDQETDQIYKIFDPADPMIQSTYWQPVSQNDQKRRIENSIYNTIFKRSESAVRNAYNHKRKVYTGFTFHNPVIQADCESRFGDAVNRIILSLVPTIKPPTAKTEQELNVLSVNRWKIRIEELQENFIPEKKDIFVKEISKLSKANTKNPNLENIFYEAAKFISKYDKIESIRFYIQYIYYDLLSDKIDKKPFSKSVQNMLFNSKEQVNNFADLIDKLVQSKDLENAMADADKVFQPKRKRIKLDKNEISAVVKEDHDTVELLTGYLDDGAEEGVSASLPDSTAFAIEPPNTVEQTNKAVLNKNQQELLSFLASHSFIVPGKELNVYCKSIGSFMQQLIDGINESCYEVLDDLLIETDGEAYTLNQKYYQQIVAA